MLHLPFAPAKALDKVFLADVFLLRRNPVLARGFPRGFEWQDPGGFAWRNPFPFFFPVEALDRRFLDFEGPDVLTKAVTTVHNTIVFQGHTTTNYLQHQ